MPNPWEARGFQTSEEVTGELAGYLERLTALGATPDELAAAAATWDQFDDDWTPERRYQWVRQPDHVLRDAILSVRSEFTAGTTDPDDIDAAHHKAAVSAAMIEARERVGYTVPNVLEWVGDDPARADAMRIVENEKPKPRTSLLAALDEVT